MKRLATSLVLAGRESGQSARRCEQGVRAFVASYRQHLREFAIMPFARLAHHLITRRSGDPVLDDILREAERMTPARNLRKLTIETHGRIRFHDERPDLEHVPSARAAAIVNALKRYRATLNASHRRTFERYQPHGC